MLRMIRYRPNLQDGATNPSGRLVSFQKSLGRYSIASYGQGETIQELVDSLDIQLEHVTMRGSIPRRFYVQSFRPDVEALYHAA